MSKLARLALGLMLGALAVAVPAAPGWAAPSNAAVEPATDPNSRDFRWHLLNPHPCVRDTVVLVVAGFHFTGCDSFIAAFPRDSVHVVYHTLVLDSIACPAVLPRTYPIPIRLGLFSAGPQRIEVEWVIDHRTPSGRTYTEVRRVPIDFYVSAECTVFGRLPYVDHVQIGPPNGRVPPCVPPGDSIPVLIAGHFPSNCFRFVRIEVLPDLTLSPLPHSPRVRVTVDDMACLLRPCIEEPVRWSASVKLPPLPPFDYKLPVEVAQVTCSDSFPPGHLFVAGFPFVVSGSCAIATACVLPLFDPRGEPHECDARIGPGQSAQLALYLRSTVALSGLQGELALSDSALHVTALAPAGPAQGMLLSWEPTPRGARFLMISKQGAPIPPTAPGEPAPAVLAIQVELGPGHPRSPVTRLLVTQLLAADAEGHGVGLCPTLFADAPRMAAVANICSAEGAQCDFNGDGREDIRDLVLMVRCLRDGLCGDLARFDCNLDGSLTLDDVLCCAERMLSQDCAGCPPGATRDARDVKITFGLPIGRAPSPDLPIRIEGASGIGGARLALRFPQDRYEIRGVDYGGAAASWLHLSQVSEGRLLVGLIDPSGVAGTEPTAEITLHLALKPGQQPGGEVALESADLTAHDGVRLAAAIPQLRQPLGGTPRLALSESRPNPFAAEARFAVTLDRPGAVEIGIFDLSGRRLVTLFRGDLPAGTHEFAWDGRLANGSAARDGVYFYRAQAGAQTLARKLVLLRRR